MSDDVRSKFLNVHRAPKGVAKSSRGGTKALIRGAAPVVISECLNGTGDGFTPRAIFDQVPRFAASYTSANALATALGAGVRGRGLGLHRDPAGRFLRCRENAALAAAELGDGEFAALVRGLGYDGPDELGDAIDRLPPAPEGAPTP
jgi:hypothetical protein